MIGDYTVHVKYEKNQWHNWIVNWTEWIVPGFICFKQRESKDSEETLDLIINVNNIESIRRSDR